MKNKRIIIIILIAVLSIVVLLYFFKGNRYTINDITDYLKQYNVEFKIKDIKDQKIILKNITNDPLALFECSLKNNSSIKFYIYETYSMPGLPFGKNVLADNYKKEVNSYLKDKYIKKIIIENADSIDNAINEIDSIRQQIYYEKYNVFGITPSSNDNSDYICFPINYINNEKEVCFQYGEEIYDILRKNFIIQKR